MRRLLALIAVVRPVRPAGSGPLRRGLRSGLLDCVVEAGTGFIIGSSSDFSCSFRSGQRPPVGALSAARCGSSASISGTPRKPSSSGPCSRRPRPSYRPGALAGSYVGASAEVTVGGRRGSKCAGRWLRQDLRAAAGQRTGTGGAEPRRGLELVRAERRTLRGRVAPRRSLRPENKSPGGPFGSPAAEYRSLTVGTQFTVGSVIRKAKPKCGRSSPG